MLRPVVSPSGSSNVRPDEYSRGAAPHIKELRCEFELYGEFELNGGNEVDNPFS